MRILGGYMDTRTNEEDFAITPYLFGVWHWQDIKVVGLGICWGWAALYVAIGFNVPAGFPGFSITRRRNEGIAGD